MSLAPVAIFVYNRPDHAQQTIESLLKNAEAPRTDLYIFSDGAKADKDKDMVKAVREYVHTVTGFASVTVIEQQQNIGLAASITTGVTMVVNKHGKIIQMDDDLLVSPYFLRFMNDALDHYENNDKVACVCAFLYPVRKKVPANFFLKGADCCIWGTWKRAWDMYEPDGRKLLHELEQRRLTFKFDFDGAYPYTQMLRDQIEGKNDSWAIRWLASAYLKDKYTLYPGKSMARNIGMDNSGTNSGQTNSYDQTVSMEPIPILDIPVEQSRAGYVAFREFFTRLYNNYSFFKRKRRRFKRWVKYLIKGI
ncbi:glycosyltransferase family A protein [Chitinophaga sp. HK235]|uniref:glycosyltransferase family A protein n=1 Tax=Chitinophaga sp. HK235 TaxID=2952571 RepID=UPI001BA8BFC2|nr:glycosyltransferase family A protein [Chitinophaga sp. HK235]